MYNKDIYKEPFWAENSGFMTGRDPLGIQNSSVATYRTLLPGMTNLTRRLRYYGFYSWALYEYYNQENVNETKLSYHYNFIRRSELVIAYLMVNNFENEKSIVGSDFAKKNIIEKNGYYDIALGADKFKSTKKGSVYWDFSSGALGQYYAGSLLNLNIINKIGKFYNITDKGKELALSFKDNVGENAVNLFLRVVDTGILYKKQIDELNNFSIANIPFDTKEWKLYVDLLIFDDTEKYLENNKSNSSLRRETIKYYLSYLKDKENKKYLEGFPEIQYENNLKKKKDDASFGWYYYYLNEMIHFSLESIFWGFLVQLDGKIISINKFLEEFNDEILKKSTENFLKNTNESVSEVLKDLKINSHSLKKDFKNLVKLIKSTENSIEAISLAFKIILQIYNENQQYKQSIIEYEKENILFDKFGRVTQNFKDLIEDHFNDKYSNYFESCIKNMINDHVITAYRKMGNGESNLLKFIIEDNNIIHIQTMEPKFTSPRLGTLNDFLNDLGYINNEGSLSRTGKKLLLKL